MTQGDRRGSSPQHRVKSIDSLESDPQPGLSQDGNAAWLVKAGEPCLELFSAGRSPRSGDHRRGRTVRAVGVVCY